MTKPHFNCDCGEGVTGSEHDLQLLNYVDAINIACGGHAVIQNGHESY